MKHKSLLALAVILPLLTLAQVPAALKNKFTIDRQLTNQYFVFEKAGKYGVVNPSGAIVLPAAYDNVLNTQFGLFVVASNSMQGVVDTKNKTVLPFEFDRINILSPQRIHVLKDYFPMILSASNRFLKDTTESPQILLQVEGNMLTPPMILQEELLEDARVDHFLKTDNGVFILRSFDTLKTAYNDIQRLTHDGLLARFKQGDRWGVVDQTGKERMPAIYNIVYEDYNTRLIVVDSAGWRSLLDANLQPIAAGPFDGLSFFTWEGVAIATRQGNAKLIDRNGQTIAERNNTLMQEYMDHFFLAQDRTTGAMELIDSKGRSILPAGIQPTGYSGSIILATTPDKKMGVFHAARIPLLQPIYDEVFFGNTDDEDTQCFQVRRGDKWGVVDITGKQLIPFVYDKISLFSKGYATAVLNKKGGVISDQNKIVIPFIYDQTAYEFNEQGLLRVKKDGKYGFLNKSGAVVIPIVYSFVNEDFEQGLSLAQKDGKWGFLDPKGKSVIPFEYDEARPVFYNDKTKARKGTTWYEIDKTGKVLGETTSAR